MHTHDPSTRNNYSVTESRPRTSQVTYTQDSVTLQGGRNDFATQSSADLTTNSTGTAEDVFEGCIDKIAGVLPAAVNPTNSNAKPDTISNLFSQLIRQKLVFAFTCSLFYSLLHHALPRGQSLAKREGSTRL